MGVTTATGAATSRAFTEKVSMFRQAPSWWMSAMSLEHKAKTSPDLPPSAMELALNGIAATLEEMLPGFCDLWVERAESDALHCEIRRLHAAAVNPVLVANLREATALAQRARFVAKSHARLGVRGLEPPKRRKDRG